MKKNIALLIIPVILLLAALFVGTASAQAKHLPDTVRVKLPAADLIAFSAKIDSMQTALVQTSNLPSAWLQSFMQRVNATLYLLYKQVNDQMVAEKANPSPAVPVKQVKRPYAYTATGKGWSQHSGFDDKIILLSAMDTIVIKFEY